MTLRPIDTDKNWPNYGDAYEQHTQAPTDTEVDGRTEQNTNSQENAALRRPAPGSLEEKFFLEDGTTADNFETKKAEQEAKQKLSEEELRAQAALVTKQLLAKKAPTSNGPSLLRRVGRIFGGND